MTCVLEILSIHELIKRKTYLLKQLEKIEKELIIRDINLNELILNNIPNNLDDESASKILLDDESASKNVSKSIYGILNDESESKILLDDESLSKNVSKSISNILVNESVSNTLHKEVLNTKKKITIKKLFINDLETKIDDTKKIKIKVNIKK